ncbi:hypothetical protein [Sphingomonas sp. Root1294]|nr:hypothetical protein [Sphingomonas sp. Root1294]
MIRLIDRSYVLVDAGKTAQAQRSKVASIPAGVMEVDDEGNVVDLPEAPKDLPQLDHDKDGEPGGSTSPSASDELKAVRAEYKAKMGKNFFPAWDVAELRRRMGDA